MSNIMKTMTNRLFNKSSENIIFDYGFLKLIGNLFAIISWDFLLAVRIFRIVCNHGNFRRIKVHAQRVRVVT